MKEYNIPAVRAQGVIGRVWEIGKSFGVRWLATAFNTQACLRMNIQNLSRRDAEFAEKKPT